MQSKITISLLVFLQISVSFLLSALYVKSQVSDMRQEQADIYKEYTKVKVISTQAISKTIVENKLTPIQAAEYGDLYIQILSKSGYLVIDERNIIAGIESHSEPLPSLAVIKQKAKQMNIEPKKNYQELLNNSPVIKLIEEFTQRINGSN
jgi:hypothetical protein